MLLQDITALEGRWLARLKASVLSSHWVKQFLNLLNGTSRHLLAATASYTDETKAVLAEGDT